MADRVCRLFFALWPGAPVRDVLAGLQDRIGGECGGRPVAPENLHVTLKFLGQVPQSDLDEVRGVAARAPVPRVDLVLDRVGYWPRPAVVFAGADEVPAALAELAGYLDESLAALGFTPERRRFRAHCTLFRKARCRPAASFHPLAWPVHGFVLAASETHAGGVRYRPVGRWPAR